MDITMLKAKLHRLRVTEANLYYEGSITVDRELLETVARSTGAKGSHQASRLPSERPRIS
ncbi:MAG: hypothetical protein BRD27_03435, partial [Bacteroidetes bacterium QH_10_64_19]